MVTILLLFLGQSLWKFPRFSMQKWLPHEERQKKKKISECKEKIGGGAVDFVLMMPIHDTRF